MTNFNHNPESYIGIIFDELAVAKFRKLILTELESDIKVIVQNEIKEDLKNETENSDQSVSNSYLKEIYISK